MNDRAAIKKNPWRYTKTVLRHKLTLLNVGANMVGAGIVASYFLFFEQTFAEDNIKNYFVVIGVMFAVLVIIGTIFFRYWQKDLAKFVDLKLKKQAADFDLTKRAQHKILNLPQVSSLVSMFNWFLAAITMTVTNFLSYHENSLTENIFVSLRTFVGVIIAGIVTCAIIFFTVEIFCRKIWPYFFPDGGLIKTAGVFPSQTAQSHAGHFRAGQFAAHHFNGGSFIQ